MKLMNFCILAAVVFLCAVSVPAQNNLLNSENNQNFIADIQPGLLEQIADSETVPFDYMLAAKRLGVYGDVAAVPVIARELGNPAKSESARNALEEMPFPEALEVLRSAAENVSDPLLKAGIFDSLGMRRDREAVPVLLKYLNDENETVADAALFALSRIADPAVKDALLAKMSEGTENARRKGSDLALMYGDFLRRDGNESEALTVFRAVAKDGFAEFHREAAYYQILLNENQADIDEVYQWFTGDDRAAYLGAIRAVQFAKGERILRMLAAAYSELSEDRKPAAAAVLASWTIPETRGIVVGALSSSNPELRNAAVNAFQSHIDRDTLLSFIDAVIDGDDELKERASALIVRFDETTDPIFLELLDGDEDHQKIGAAAVALRKIFDGRDKVMQLAESPSPQLRDAGLAALGAVADMNAFRYLADRLASGDTAPAPGLKKACGTVEDKDAAAVYLEKIDSSLTGQKEIRAVIFDCYTILGGNTSLAAVERAALSNNNESRDLATQALGKWMSADASVILLKLAETKGYPYANRALRGLLRLAKQFQMEEAQRSEILQRASVSPAGNDETKKIIDTIMKQYQM